MPSRTQQRIAAGFAASLLVASCSVGGSSALTPGESPPADTAVIDAVREALSGSGTALRRPQHLGAVAGGLTALYAPDQPPLWTTGGRATEGAAVAVRTLLEATTQGLVPEDYDGPWLARQLGAVSAGGVGVPDLALFEATLSVEVLRYLEALHRGRVKPSAVGFAYHSEAEGPELALRLRQALAEGGLATLVAALEPGYPQYARLKAALARQRAGAADATNLHRVRQLELAMERLRWLPHAPTGRFIVANVPAFRLVAFSSARDLRPALQMAIVVGKAARTETPLFTDEIDHVLFRPSWYPPPSILLKEIAPILGRDPDYLRREHMDIVAETSDTSAALPLDADTLSRLRQGRLALRQNPGPHNALGLVKFVFPNQYRVYMHDTPARSLFARGRRDFSHGCIRVERPVELAEFALSSQPGWTRERIGAAMKGQKTVRVGVGTPIPVFIFYTTAIVRADGTVEYFDDIYGLDAQLDWALSPPAAP